MRQSKQKEVTRMRESSLGVASNGKQFKIRLQKCALDIVPQKRQVAVKVFNEHPVDGQLSASKYIQSGRQHSLPPLRAQHDAILKIGTGKPRQVDYTRQAGNETRLTELPLKSQIPVQIENLNDDTQQLQNNSIADSIEADAEAHIMSGGSRNFQGRSRLVSMKSFTIGSNVKLAVTVKVKPQEKNIDFMKQRDQNQNLIETTLLQMQKQHSSPPSLNHGVSQGSRLKQGYIMPKNQIVPAKSTIPVFDSKHKPAAGSRRQIQVNPVRQSKRFYPALHNPYDDGKSVVLEQQLDSSINQRTQGLSIKDLAIQTVQGQRGDKTYFNKVSRQNLHVSIERQTAIGNSNQNVQALQNLEQPVQVVYKHLSKTPLLKKNAKFSGMYQNTSSAGPNDRQNMSTLTAGISDYDQKSSGILKRFAQDSDRRLPLRQPLPEQTTAIITDSAVFSGAGSIGQHLLTTAIPAKGKNKKEALRLNDSQKSTENSDSVKR